MTDLAISSSSALMPALSLAQAIERRNLLVQITKEIMAKDTDYGVIPGTQKPTLLKPGAEKLCSQFGLVPTFERIDVIRDWTGETHGAPLFSFEYRCRLWRDGQPVGEGIGSCNSWEKKYRYRTADRACPNCGATAIKKSKFPPKSNPKDKPGWYCYSKAGGCGAEFAHDDPTIVNQECGQQPNPDIFDQINTIDKMAQKRALIAATLVATNASEFFTQDIEDMQVIDVTPAGASYTPAAPAFTRTVSGFVSKVEAKYDAKGRLFVRFECDGRTVLYEAPELFNHLQDGDKVLVRGELASSKSLGEYVKAASVTLDDANVLDYRAIDAEQKG